MLAVQKTDSAFQRGLGGEGSDMAAKGVKTGSWGPKKILDDTVLCPSKAQLYRKNLIP